MNENFASISKAKKHVSQNNVFAFWPENIGVRVSFQLTLLLLKCEFFSARMSSLRES